MRGIGVEEQRVPRLHAVEAVAMAVHHLALQHVEELHAGMLEGREDVGLGGQRDQIGFDLDAGAVVGDVAEQVVLVAGARAPPLQLHPLPRLHEARAMRLLVAAEEGGDRQAERPGQRLQRGQRGGDVAVLDLGQHADRYARRGGQVLHRQPEQLALRAHLVADRQFEIVGAGLADGVRVLRQGGPGLGRLAAAFRHEHSEGAEPPAGHAPPSALPKLLL